MTTTISLPTRDCIVIGCDSLATSSQTILDPYKLLSTFFDEDGKLKSDDSGAPILDHVKKLFAYTEQLPKNQLPNVTKIFSLHPYKAGLLFAGISGIGSKSIRSLVETFVGNELKKNGLAESAALENVGNALLHFLDQEFEVSFPDIDRQFRPSMEILLSGYSADSRNPQIFRLHVGAEKSLNKELQEDRFDIVFGGQHDVIQRVVKGIDFESYCNLIAKSETILNRYHSIIQEWLKGRGITVDIPPPDTSQEVMQLFGGDFGGVRGIFSDNGSLSEQAAINFVEFLVNTMINAQEFSDKIPTVGGQIHVAIITPAQGFRWISKEEYRFQGHSVPRYEHH
jgi:hypothetical protein